MSFDFEFNGFIFYFLFFFVIGFSGGSWLAL